MVNGDEVDPEAQWTYVNADNDNKTSSVSFNIQAGFAVDQDTAGIKIYPAAGVEVENNPQVVSYRALSGKLKYGNGGSVEAPFNAYAGYVNFNSISRVEDPYGLISSIEDSSFHNCTNLSSIECGNALAIGKNAFFHCYGLISIDLPNAL